jgi:hypothetical protein
LIRIHSAKLRLACREAEEGGSKLTMNEEGELRGSHADSLRNEAVGGEGEMLG